MDLRLNKFISDSGFCSRREADSLIDSGRVTINGQAAELGSRVAPGDRVKVDGQLIKSDAVEIVYIALNKPRGIVSTTDPAEPNNIVDFVNYKSRIFNIGRLDKMSDGLILLTNDGNIVNKILRASNNHDKEYVVQVDRPINEDFLRRMASGIPILGTITKRCKIRQEGANSFRIVLTQGLNRQIRRMCEYLGYEVTRLKRVRIMNINLGKLPLGQWRFLSSEEISTLMNSIKDSDGTQAASEGAGAGRKNETSRQQKSQIARSNSPRQTSTKQRVKTKGATKASGAAKATRTTNSASGRLTTKSSRKTSFSSTSRKTSNSRPSRRK